MIPLTPGPVVSAIAYSVLVPVSAAMQVGSRSVAWLCASCERHQHQQQQKKKSLFAQHQQQQQQQISLFTGTTGFN